jgi:hypothetical protein
LSGFGLKLVSKSLHGAKIKTQITGVLRKKMKFTGNTRLALAAPLPGSDQFRTLRQSQSTNAENAVIADSAVNEHLSRFTFHLSPLRAAAVAALALSLACTATVRANDVDVSSGKVKIGVLHSLSGTMAISETSLRDTLLFAFDEINKGGGILGKQIESMALLTGRCSRKKQNSCYNRTR